LYVNLNLKSSSGSAQVTQVPQVTGHAADTPVNAQRLVVSFSATQVQYLEMLLPSFLIFNRNAESTHATVGGGVVNGAVVGWLGAAVGPIGAADGVGEGLIDAVGTEVGASLGT
jgi:hypothetical protein